MKAYAVEDPGTDKLTQEKQAAILKEMEDTVTEMDMIQIAEYREMVGCYYIWRAK